MLTAGEVSRMLAERVEDTARFLLPNAQVAGDEICVGSTNGEPGKSLKLKLKGDLRGRWKDFATDEGGDILDLWAMSRGIDLPTAYTQAKEWLGVGREPFRAPLAKKFRKPAKPRCVPAEGEVLEYLTEQRMLTEDTVRKFGIGSAGEKMFLPYFLDGELVMCKFRNVRNKREQGLTSSGQEPVLFGWQAMPPLARHVVLCEGEIDCMSVDQIGLPALSVPFGGGAGGKQAWIDHEWERLERFDEIYLCMDMDSAGEEASKYLQKRLGQYRTRVVNLPYKDFNECLIRGMTRKELVSCIEAAKCDDPEELRGAGTFLDAVKREFAGGTEATGMQLPWDCAAGKIGFRPAEITVWYGYNGHGKSQVLGHVMLDGMDQGYRWCVASMEMPGPKLLKRLFRQAAANADPSEGYMQAINDWLDGKCWLFNLTGTAKADRIIEVFRYCAMRYGVSQFVVDSLAKVGLAEDDYNSQKAFVDQLSEFAHEHDVHCHLVVHTRKGQDESQPPGKMDVKGSGALTDMADNVISVWRNVDKPESDRALPPGRKRDPDGQIKVLKQRHGEWQGGISTWFDQRSMQYLGGWEKQPKRYVPYENNNGVSRCSEKPASGSEDQQRRVSVEEPLPADE